MTATVTICPPETTWGRPEVSRKDDAMTNRPKRPEAGAEPMTLATVLAALERPGILSATRLRDLRSAVRRVADLLGNEPAAIAVDMDAIRGRLGTISPLAVGMTAKRFANVRSDFLAAVKACGVKPETGRKTLSPAWVQLFVRLSGRRGHIGLSRLARHANAHGIGPGEINDDVIAGFIATVRQETLHRHPNKLHRQVTLIWNEAARDPALGLQPVTVASFRGPPTRIDWARLPAEFRQAVQDYLSWCGGSDPFAVDARSRALAPQTLRLRRDQIHAAVSALVECGVKPASIGSLADLVTANNVKSVLRRRFENVGGEENTFNYTLASVLVQIAREWVKVDPPVLAELKRLVGKLPAPAPGLTHKNKRFLRQFDDPKTLRRLVQLPDQLLAEVRRDSKPSMRTLAKAQAALGIAIVTYMPLRVQNLTELAFGTHLFVRAGAGQISTLELSRGEVKNKTELAYDIPTRVAKTLLEYRDRIAPKIIGHRPARLFVKVDGTAKGVRSVARLIVFYAKTRAGIILSPHQFRHLSAKVLLDAQPGAFETVRQLLGHNNMQTTVNAYAGIDSRRAARHHQHLIDKAIELQDLSRRRPARRSRFKK
jgi:integrase